VTPSRLRTFALCGVVAGVLAFVYALGVWARGWAPQTPADSTWRELETADYV
jgi:hypothetical protein